MTTDMDGTRITVTMRLRTYVMVFLCIWFGFIGSGFLLFLTLAFSKPEFIPAPFILFGLLLFACLLTKGSFRSESNTSKKELQELFQAEIV